MLRTDDFLQADRLTQVGDVASAVSNGNYADDDIERYLGLDSGGRQGRYYRLAAEKLGLIINQGNHAALTPLGEEFSRISAPSAKLEFLARCLTETPVFKDGLQYVEKVHPSDEQLRLWFRGIYPGAASTADRRFNTFISYLRDSGLLKSEKNANRLVKFKGSVATTENSPSTFRNTKRSPPAHPPKSLATGVLRIDIDAQKRERANTIHWQLIDAKASFLAGKGFAPHSNVHVDLFTSSADATIFYEMKSIDPQGSNLLSQIRKAVSQLYEYRYIYGDPSMVLCIVTNSPLAKQNEWILEYLANDRSIGYEWTEDFNSFECHANTQSLLGVFST